MKTRACRLHILYTKNTHYTQHTIHYINYRTDGQFRRTKLSQITQFRGFRKKSFAFLTPIALNDCQTITSLSVHEYNFHECQGFLRNSRNFPSIRYDIQHTTHNILTLHTTYYTLHKILYPIRLVFYRYNKECNAIIMRSQISKIMDCQNSQSGYYSLIKLIGLRRCVQDKLSSAHTPWISLTSNTQVPG